MQTDYSSPDPLSENDTIDFLPLNPYQNEFGEVDEIDEEVLLELVSNDEEPLDDYVANKGSFSGTAASVIFHVWLIFTLAGIAHENGPGIYEAPLETIVTVSEEQEELPEEVVEFELANPKDRDLEVREVVHAASMGLLQTKEPKVESPPDPLPKILDNQARAEAYDIPEGMQVNEKIVVKGSTGEGMIEIESALDRVTWEIANNLQESKVLVVWLLDASGSLTKQREAVAKRMNRIYGELDALDNAGQIPRREQPLLSGVVAYGAKTTYMTPEPTDDYQKVVQAIEEINIDITGQENVFQAVTQVMSKWSKYRTTNGRRIMLITVTDESGDDFQNLETSIKYCRRYGAQAYVVGPAAVYGRRKGYINYVAPEDSNTYQLEVDLGPETPMITRLDLPFWYNGPDYRYISSGFGPYGLARLVKETGGIYFLSGMTTMETLTPVGIYNGENLKPFEPEYDFATPEEYLANMSKFPIRAAVYQAALVSRQNEMPGMPMMEFRVTDQNFRQTAEEAQRQVAITQFRIEGILALFPPELERFYDKEPSARWRMAYNLAYGRLLAQKIRCLEYNACCADLKGSLTPQDINTKSNEWIFQPSAKLNYAIQGRRWEEKARELLQRVIDEAPGTPWAILAQRELKDPMGIKVVHNFIPPPTPEELQAAAAAAQRRRIRLAADPRPPATPQPPPPPRPKPQLPRL